MILQIDGGSKLFGKLAKIMLCREVGKEIGYPVYHYDNSKYCVEIIDNQIIGFVSYRQSNGKMLFEYDYIQPSHRGSGTYMRLFKTRERICKGNVCFIETRNDKLKRILSKNNYKQYKTNGTWSYFQKILQ